MPASIANRLVALAVFVAAFMVADLRQGSAQTASTAAVRPIVAALFAEPSKYVGTRIEIYGLVISADTLKRSFLLQDVSQRPLLVDAMGLPTIRAGDQVEIDGVLESRSGNLVLVAQGVKRVQVTGGGGCC